MIETFRSALPHGITLSCRATGERGRPVLMFLHGFPEAAFVWDELLEHFARPENGGYRCIAPNLRGFEKSSAAGGGRGLPRQAPGAGHRGADRRSKARAARHAWWRTTGAAPSPGAWPTSMPQLMSRLAIINSPHPATFLRELKTNPSSRLPAPT